MPTHLAAHASLRRSFIHLPGVGPRKEAQLWGVGVTDWAQLASEAARHFKGVRLEPVQRALDASLAAWERGDLHHFHAALPSAERWRLVPGAFADAAFFDIEADGGGLPPRTRSTAIAFLFRGELHQEHDPARKRALLEWITTETPLLVSYNGASYDVPFLTAEFRLPFAVAHVDLCPWMRRLGFRGGLKGIQRALPELHQRGGEDIDGFDAIKLWQMHRRGVPGALETLLTYNAEDVLILEPLLAYAYHRELAARPEWAHLPALAPRATPALATRVDAAVYALLRGERTLAADGSERRPARPEVVWDF
jgi:uncharacterized protein YprB with RNaseH-like and TPR domain